MATHYVGGLSCRCTGKGSKKGVCIGLDKGFAKNLVLGDFGTGVFLACWLMLLSRCFAKWVDTLSARAWCAHLLGRILAMACDFGAGVF